MPTNMTQEQGRTYIIPENYDEAEFEVSEDEKAFESFASEAKDNEQYSKLTVSRVPMNRHGQRGAQKLSFLFEAAIDEYSYSQLLGKLRDEYGSGFYKIQARNEKGQLKLNKTVAVEAPVNETDKSAADNPTTLVIEQFSRSLAEQQSEMREIMSQNKPASGGDAIDQIVKIAGAIAPVLAALGISRPEAPPAPKSLMEQLTEMKMIQELMGSSNDGPQGEANGWSALTETLKALGPAIGGALAAGASQTTPEAVPQLEAPQERLPEVDQQKLREKQVAETKEALAQQINMLLIQAKGGADPLAVAKVVVDMTPQAHEERLWDSISDEQCVDKMIEVVPEVAEHHEWFESLRDGIIEIMAEPEQDLPPPDDEVNEDNENLTDGRNFDKNAASNVVAGVDPVNDAPNESDSPRNS